MSTFQVIVLATPIFLLLMGIEFAVGLARQQRGTGRNTYRLNDTINSVSLGVISQLSGVFSKLLTLGIYTAVYSAVAIGPGPEFWNTWYGALLALVFYDFCYYWLHRAGHEVAVLWAAHSVHHQSQDYNLGTALRQTSSGHLLGWIFYLPMAVAGVPPVLVAIVGLVDLLYQFWVHTEQIGKLGWFDRVFCSPSNHRVHHAVNDRYVDRNYGGILILWDRLFGSFKEEDEPCVYGTRGPLQSWDPLWANLQVYAALAKDSWRTRRWSDKLKVWFKPPGWQSTDLAQRFPKPAFALSQVTRFDPPLNRATSWFAAVQFVVFLQGVSAVLWFAGSMPPVTSAIWCAVLGVGYWCIGAVLQGRLNLWAALMIEMAALATASSALGLSQLHLFAKPAVMLIAIILIARDAHSMSSSGHFYRFLLLALTACLVGDVALMLPGNFFIAGLAAFLVGHVFFLTAFRLGQAWFPSRFALLAALATGAGVYCVLFPALPGTALKFAVAAYVLVIALMVAQAWGRAMTPSRIVTASVLAHATDTADTAGTARPTSSKFATPALWVAVGASLFMLSDLLLAINRFITPIGLAPLWILSTYYVAQVLIVLNARPVHSAASVPQNAPTAGKSVDAVKTAQAGIGLVAIDPARSVDIGQTPPYVIIEGALVAPAALL